MFWFSLFSHWSRTGIHGLAEFAGYFGEFGFAGSGEEVAARCAEEETVEGHAGVGMPVCRKSRGNGCIMSYMYSGDTRQQQQHCMHMRTDICASLVTPHFGKRRVKASQLALSRYSGFYGYRLGQL